MYHCNYSFRYQVKSFRIAYGHIFYQIIPILYHNAIQLQTFGRKDSFLLFAMVRVNYPRPEC